VRGAAPNGGGSAARWRHSRARRRLARLRPRSRLRVEPQHPSRPLRVPRRYLDLRPPDPAPSISIVTPSLNQAEYLEGTIRSVLDQGYPNLEYAVCDGGSRDSSPQILERYGPRLHYWTSSPDSGHPDAVNRGIARCGGEILAYLNSDDLLLPGSLAYVGRYFADNPGADVIYGHRVLIDERGGEIGRWVLPPHDDEVLLWQDYVPQETLFWRRRVWEATGGSMDDAYHFSLDWDLLLRFRRAGARFWRVPRFLGAFRVHPSQKTSSQIGTAGEREINALRRRELGREPDAEELRRHVAAYLRRHIVLDRLYRAGVVRY
jgi:glycosyltransferase involved in cell wall biosynthesis